MCHETYGYVSVLSSALHRSMCLFHEQRDEYNEAYGWLVKSCKIREKVGTLHVDPTLRLRILCKNRIEDFQFFIDSCYFPLSVKSRDFVSNRYV